MTTYLRYPHIHQDLLTLVAADDIWLAPIEGGRAWRITDDNQPVRTPRFSPDGGHIAFVSFRDGHPEVYVVAVDGSESPRRLTWWGAKNTLVLGWTEDARPGSFACCHGSRRTRPGPRPRCQSQRCDS